MRQDPCVIVNQAGHFFAYWGNPSIPSLPVFTTSPELAHQYYNATSARRTLRRLDPVYGEGINYCLVRYSQCHNARCGAAPQACPGGIIDSMQTTEKNSEAIQVAPVVVVRRMGQLHLYGASPVQYRRHLDGTNRFFRVTVEEVSYDEMSKDMGL